MHPRTAVASATACALALVLAAPAADALILARVTRHGYIMVDEPDAVFAYNGHATIGTTSETFGVISDVLSVIDNTDGAPHGQYLAVMQTSYENSALAFYLGLVNDTRGIGITSPLGDHRETYDINSIAGTPFPITGFVFLNSIMFYDTPGLSNYGRYLICTQEFGHHYGTFVRNPPQPAAALPPDGGADDGGATDAAVDTGTTPGPDLAATALLGRQTAHWSYFVNTGGSPMEGNNWEELSPGVFRTGRVSFHFSDLDLYIMGLLPASAVQPFYVIAEPDVMGQRDQSGQTIFNESPPEYSGRTITIRGRKVTFTVDDIIRANGERVPTYQDPDGGDGDGGGGDASVGDGGGGDASVDDGGVATAPQANMDVMWVLLTTPDRVSDSLATAFDNAIESCTGGYNGASDNRSQLVATVLPTDAGDDAAADGAAGDGARDGSEGDGGIGAENVHPSGGCGCRTTPGGGTGAPRGASTVLLAAAGAALVSRRRRGRA